MLEAILSAVLGAVIEGVRAWLKERRAEQALRDLGAATTRLEITHAEDAARRRADDVRPGDPADLPRRLRDEL